MSDLIRNIGSGISKVLNFGGGKLIPAALAGAGTIGNFLTGRKANQAVDQQLAWQKYVQQLVSNPGAFSKFAQGYTQPLTAGLVQGVENQDQAWLAEHGLTQSPALAGDVVNQSLAPYIQQQQNQGLQAAFNALGLGNNPYALSALNRQGTDLTGLLKLLMSPQSPRPVGQTPGGTHTTPVDINPATDPTLDSGDATAASPVDLWSQFMQGGGFSPGGAPATDWGQSGQPGPLGGLSWPNDLTPAAWDTGD